jgi:hypothetical protein
MSCPKGMNRKRVNRKKTINVNPNRIVEVVRDNADDRQKNSPPSGRTMALNPVT